MYDVKLEMDGKTVQLYHPYDEELILIDPVVTQAMGTTDNFVFRISPTHPCRNMIRPLRGVITVYDDGEIVFRGRPWKLDSESDFITRVSCEGELAYLLDSMVPPFDFTGSIHDFFAMLVETHNSQVEERKRFILGNITVTGKGNDLHFVSSTYMATIRVMDQYLMQVYGGSCHARYAGAMYVDYVLDYGTENRQPIQFGENLVDIKSIIDPSNFITVLIPTGAKIENDDVDQPEKILDITSVNGGKNYIVNQEAYDVYDWICGTKSFDEVTDPEVLMLKGKEYLDKMTELPESITVTAVDLGILDADVKKLRTGCWTVVDSAPHGIKKKFLLTKRTFNLLDPSMDTVALGAKRPSLSGGIAKNNADTNQKIKKVETSTTKEIIRKIANATALITGGKGGYVVLDIYDPDTGKKMHPWRILIMNTPDKATAKNVIQINQNGIGFSTTGINGPYTNAWTIDGNLVADFITAGTMLADRIRGGVLELGGSGLGRDGKIIIYSSTGKLIGTIDKFGASFVDGSFVGGSIEIGDVFWADEGGAKLGDYKVSANGTSILKSANGHVEFDCAQPDENSPGGAYATLHVGGDKYAGVDINGTGQIHCGGIKCLDVRFNDSWTEGMSAMEMFRQVYDRLNQLRRHTEYGEWS